MLVAEAEPSPSQDTLEQERPLHQLQRMAMLGTLAAGLGHDLRNLVMPVLLRLDVLSASDGLSEEVRNDLAGIRRSIMHLQRLAGGLRLLSSDPFDQRDEAQVTSLPEWWQELQPVVIDALPPDATLRARIPDGLPTAAVPPGVIAQVVINLVMNARRAMEGTTSPTLELRVHEEPGALRLEVMDNGKGMDAETRSRCFEPYFTTRPREYATGLGLSTGRALMHQYGGDLTLSVATEGGGATFTIRVPAGRSTGSAGVNDGRRVGLLVRDPRQLAVLRRILTQRGLREVSPPVAGSVDVLVCDQSTLSAVLGGGHQPGCQIVAIGPPPNDLIGVGSVRWVAPPDLSRVGDLLR